MSQKSTTNSHQQLISYLCTQGLQVQSIDDNACAKILQMTKQKDETIRLLEQQITKYKAEQMKNNKLISQLQDKITQICPNNNNTGSSFMMAAEFKQFFDDFMKNTLPACLSPLLSYPEAYAQYCSMLFTSVYNKINAHIRTKIAQICSILQLDPTQKSLNLVRSCLIKLLQDNWQKLLNYSEQNTNTSFISEITEYQNSQASQIAQSQQFEQLHKKLVKICGYMILQDKKWSFIFPNCEKQNVDKKDKFRIEKYTKKQYVCIDSWIKQKQDVIVILQGLSRQSEQNATVVKHPNLRNYVIPYTKDQQQYKLIPKIQIKTLVACQQEPITNQKIVDKDKVQKVDKQTQYSAKKPQQTSSIEKNKSQIRQNKQNIIPSNFSSNFNQIQKSSQIKMNYSDTYLRNITNKNVNQIQINSNNNNNSNNRADKIQTAIRKLNIAQQKFVDQEFNIDSISVVFSADPNLKEKYNKIINDNRNANICEPFCEKQNSVNGSLSMVKSTKLKNSTKLGNNLASDPSFEEFLSLPQRKKDLIDQLPLKKQPSRSKKSCSRKTSVGKIVGQTVAEHKQNIFSRNNKQCFMKDKQRQNCSKEAAYKDLIKQKLGYEYKTERQRPKQSKNKQKEEDRPLRIQHFKKLKEKYLNL